MWKLSLGLIEGVPEVRQITQLLGSGAELSPWVFRLPLRSIPHCFFVDTAADLSVDRRGDEQQGGLSAA